MTKSADNQRTLNGSERYSGIALHTGVRAHITFKPASADTGIQLVRTDLPGRPSVQANARNVVDVKRATTLARGEAKVHTVEHVLAALYACGIDNAIIEMDGPEPPIADGSSEPYVAMIEAAGSSELAQPRRYCRIQEPLYVRAGDTSVVALPADEYRISCAVEYGSTFTAQYFDITVSKESFINDIYKARTFCPDYDEIEALMVAGLIRGASLDNAMVRKGDAIICKDGLRYEDELVRHKILDVIGDLSLIGCRLIGHVIAIKPGHPTNVALAQTIMSAMGLNDE